MGGPMPVRAYTTFGTIKYTHIKYTQLSSEEAKELLKAQIDSFQKGGHVTQGKGKVGKGL